MVFMTCPNTKNCEDYKRYVSKKELGDIIIERKDHYGSGLEDERYVCMALNNINQSRSPRIHCSHLEQLNLLNQLKFQRI